MGSVLAALIASSATIAHNHAITSGYKERYCPQLVAYLMWYHTQGQAK